MVRGQLQLGWWQACLSEKNNLSHRDLDHWTLYRNNTQDMLTVDGGGVGGGCDRGRFIERVGNGVYQPSFILDIYSDQRSDWANP